MWRRAYPSNLRWLREREGEYFCLCAWRGLLLALRRDARFIHLYQRGGGWRTRSTTTRIGLLGLLCRCSR